MTDVTRHALTRMPDVEMTKELEKSPYDQRQRREKRVLANSIEIDLVSSSSKVSY